MNATSQLIRSAAIRCCVGVLLLSVPLLGRGSAAITTDCLFLLLMCIPLLLLHLLQPGRLTVFFGISSVLCYLTPLLYIVHSALHHSTSDCVSSGLVLCESAVVGQMQTLPFYLSVTLATHVLSSLHLYQWLVVLRSLRDRYPRTALAMTLSEHVILIAATALYDFENLFRGKMRSVAVIQASYEHAQDSLMGWCHARAVNILAELECFTGTVFELALTLAVTPIQQGNQLLVRLECEEMSRYGVESLRKFYESYSMGTVVDARWQQALARRESPDANLIVADVGSGNGRLLRSVTLENMFIEAFEPDTAFHDKLDAIASEMGVSNVHVSKKPFESTDAIQQFDLIILMNNVLLEMLADSSEEDVFSMLCASLKPTGKLLFDYPDRTQLAQEAALRRLTSGNWGRFHGHLDISCAKLSGSDIVVEGRCEFQFHAAEAEELEVSSGSLIWFETANWYEFMHIEERLAEIGFREVVKHTLDAPTVIPASMMLFECSK